ncbi:MULTISPECIES: efflux transporter outer membrane subunit [Brenneria]|uniref:Protein CyaE n=1 Tax=Brenneria nigrifluens DSM 30175 = ATCC 13028 TaxID=1121120 RepID=A0A2U1UPZ0_9GAMM|nr:MULTISPECIES: efflux transporter outer membrane subunit [Brenneria]EHD20815.1 RND efflux system, outer membrane lipoprotein, NodT family [Brenneria sp. EniD312]PWC23726.1 transporter [Brenneria nigrifluens] [Brenneria nigrifluens DSM 30175 = ATCC 13028]QCR03985.1 efflux transporter outer membrane subunit [Brenneria nigrifluens DSM 30175 = ATCC 13028]
MRSRQFIVALLPLLLGGCLSLDPDYRHPDAPVPAAWPQQETVSSAQPEAGAIAWRSVIVDEKLQRIIDIALSDNRDLRKALADIEAARAQYGIQRAEQFPAVNAGVEGTRSRALTSDSSSNNNSTAISQSYGANLALSAFELDLFGKARSLSAAALESYLSTEAAAKSTRLTLIADTATAYIALATARSDLQLSRETMQSARHSLEVTRNRQRNGVASGVDVSQAETVYQQARADVAGNTTAVAQSKNALDLLAGQPVDDALLPADLDSLATAVAPVSAGLSSAVLLQRPDVLAAEHTLKSANADIGAARAAFFPSLTLTASGGVGSGALSSLFSHGAGVWSFAPSLSLPIFDGGANRAALQYAEAQKKGYIASYEKAIQSAFQEVADALARKATIDEQLTAQRDYAAAAERSYRLADSRYREGVDTYLNVLDAQRTLYSARQTLIVIEQTRLNNLVTLYNALGGGVATQ